MRMTWILSLALAGGILVAAPGPAHAGDLTVHDVIELHRAGLGDEVLIPLIEVDGGPFELTQADLLDLKAHGLSDRVIGALVRAGRGEPRGTPTCAAPEDAWSDPASGAECAEGSIVAVPVAVPVYVHRPRPPRRHDHVTETVFESSLGPRTRPGPAGAARASGRKGAPTVTDITQAPAGFHPGALGPRTSTASGDQPTGTTRSRGKVESRADAPRPSTPGVARGAAPAGERTKGVARGRPDSER